MLSMESSFHGALMESEPKVFQLVCNTKVLTLKRREFLAQRSKVTQNETVV